MEHVNYYFLKNKYDRRDKEFILNLNYSILSKPLKLILVNIIKESLHQSFHSLGLSNIPHAFSKLCYSQNSTSQILWLYIYLVQKQVFQKEDFLWEKQRHHLKMSCYNP